MAKFAVRYRTDNQYLSEVDEDKLFQKKWVWVY